MKKQFLLLIYLIMLMPMASAFSQFNTATGRSLFSDVKASQVGDAIMIMIIEDTQANNGAETSSARDNSVGGTFDLSTGSGSSTNIDLGLGSGNDFRGSGSTKRSEKIRSRMSARVIEIEENGNLKIRGERVTKINGEEQKIILEGVVRPVDVQSDNSVYSYSILELKLTIDGIGTVSEAQEPGLLTKFFRFLF